MNDANLQDAAPAASAAQGGWTPKGEPLLIGDQMDLWRKTTLRLGRYAETNRLSRSEVARRADVPMGTLSPWFDGKYNGNYEAICDRITKWLDAEEDRQARLVDLEEGDYIQTPTSREMWDTLMWAQTRPGLVAITLGAGMGKTTTAEKYLELVPSTYMVTMRPTTSSMHAMLKELARALQITEKSSHLVDTAIGEKLRRNGRKTLLMIDEAQHLNDEAVNQLRYFLDRYKCGIALIGNLDIQTRYGGATPREGYGQIHRRISKRLQRLKPQAGDIEALLDARQISDPESRKLLATIGQKPGALGQIVETLQLAQLLAAGKAEPLAATHIRAAWINRGNEEMR